MRALETERLWLRPITLGDAEFYMRLMNTPKWLQYIGDRNVKSVEAATVYLQDRMCSQWESHGYGNYVAWRKNSNGTETAIGCMGFFVREGLEGCDLGFAFLPEGEKQGYAFEAGTCLVKEAFQTLHLPFLNAITDQSNVDSQRLLTKLGFNFVEMITLPNETKSILKYLLKSSP